MTKLFKDIKQIYLRDFQLSRILKSATQTCLIVYVYFWLLISNSAHMVMTFSVRNENVRIAIYVAITS